MEGELYITKKGYHNEICVYVTYEYDGKHYENIGLSSRNLFTVKDGKKKTANIKRIPLG